jgi:serine/threonine protein kinase
VHRDVKPANILVGPDDRAYLSDFGTAKELAASGMTRTGVFVGTIEYCAPEQIEGGEVDARTDVYALACVLYECLAGAPPFHRDSEVAVLNAHLHAPPPRLGKAVPGLPSGLEHVLAKALSKSPLDRYATPGELISAARAASAGRRSDRRKAGLALLVLLAAALVGAAVALGVRALAFGGHSSAGVTTTSGLPRRPPFDLQQLLQLNDGRTLNDISYVLISAHRFKDALPFAQKAYRNTHANPVHAFATFNLGYVLFKTGNCRDGVRLMEASYANQPPQWQPNVRNRINAAKKRCGLQ